MLVMCHKVVMKFMLFIFHITSYSTLSQLPPSTHQYHHSSNFKQSANVLCTLNIHLCVAGPALIPFFPICIAVTCYLYYLPAPSTTKTYVVHTVYMQHALCDPLKLQQPSCVYILSMQLTFCCVFYHPQSFFTNSCLAYLLCSSSRRFLSTSIQKHISITYIQKIKYVVNVRSWQVKIRIVNVL